MKVESLDRVPVPPDVGRLMAAICRAGSEVWLVGGAIRDFLAGYRPHDWDVATNAPCRRLMELFPRVIPIGIKHNIMQIHTGERTVEVNSFDGSGPKGILRDLARRDFTVNALAAAHPSGTILDPFGGRADLSAGMLRAVEDADARFREDPLRTLRAGRFVSDYGWTIEPATFAALQRHAHSLQSTAVERIREEFFKLLGGTHIIAAFSYMRLGGVIPVILPEMPECCTKPGKGSDRCNYKHLVATVEHTPNRLRLRLAALFHEMAAAEPRVFERSSLRPSEFAMKNSELARTILTRLRASGRLIVEVAKLVEWQLLPQSRDWSDADIRRTAAAVGTEFIDDLLDLAAADRLAAGGKAIEPADVRVLRFRFKAQLAATPPLQRKDLAVSGNDLMRVLGLAPGPLLGEILAELHDVVLEEPTRNTFQDLMAHARKKFGKPAAAVGVSAG